MSKKKIGITVIICITLVLIVFGLYNLGNRLFNRYSPPTITVSKTGISSSGGFINPVTIEKLRVDSLGKEERPTKYIIEYITTCFIERAGGENAVALNEIKFNEPGRYHWSDDNTNILVVHPDGASKRTKSIQRPVLMSGHAEFDICPLKFKNDNWYFIDFRDRVFIGVYVYVDKTGLIHQYNAYGNVLPK